jgi:hypothetical protein
MSPIGPVSFVCFAIPYLLSSVGRAVMTNDAYYEQQLSDHGYGTITPFDAPQQSAVRTTHLLTTSVTSDDTCQAFYDTTFLLNDNGIERFARVRLTKLTSAMRLAPSANWSFSRTSSVLREHLDHTDRTVQYVGMRTTLAHAGVFLASDGDPPRTFVSDAPNQDCFFDVQLQYFVAFDAPTFIHIFVLDTIPRCGPRKVYEERYDSKPIIDQAALNRWINNLIKRDYQEFLRLSFAVTGVQSADEIDRVRETEPYKQLVKHCHESLNKNR